ncbi:hypothetical protein KJ742_05175 [Patescibacteria group bacterium]|nr:hypothetical protein [Patescibacteria group bacterium]MBU1683311.1 hypothetical protein [Patescibacteria group bacterium]
MTTNALSHLPPADLSKGDIDKTDYLEQAEQIIERSRHGFLRIVLGTLARADIPMEDKFILFAAARVTESLAESTKNFRKRVWALASILRWIDEVEKEEKEKKLTSGGQEGLRDRLLSRIRRKLPGPSDKS